MEGEQKMKEGMKQKAKKMALKDLKKSLKKKMGEGMDASELMEKAPMKVTVASDSEEGLKEGLSKADEILKKKMKEEK